MAVPPTKMGQDFVGTLNGAGIYSISGHVTDASNNPVSGVTISAGVGRTPTTDNNGNYTITNLIAGRYTLIPSKDGYIFSPPSRTMIAPPSRTRQDFVGTPSTAAVTPLIFIPGIMGSYLKEEGNPSPFGEWLGIPQTSHSKLTLDPTKPQAQIIATDAIRDPIPIWGGDDVYKQLLAKLTYPINSGGGGYREYKVNGIPARRTLAGCDRSQTTATLFVFAYDWRKSNAENARVLKDYVACIRVIHPNSNVDILTHSLGGLVARRYILDNPNPHYVNRLITIAAPWLGAPRATYVLETGSYGWINAFVPANNLKDLAQFFQGAHELLPSRSYFALAGSPFAELGWDINKNYIDRESYSYEAFVRLLDSRYPDTPGTTSRNFHDHLNVTGLNQDDWRSDPGDVLYYHIYGFQSSVATVGALRARQETACQGQQCQILSDLDIAWTQGDGTVPVFSAARCPPPSSLAIWDCSADHGMNAKRVFLVPIYGPNETVDHTALAHHSGVLAYVLAVLRSTQQGARAPMAPMSAPLVQPSFYLRITGAISVTVTDGLGNSTNTINGTFSTPVPSVTGLLLGNQAHMLIMPTTQAYTITLQSGTSPLSIELTQGTSITTTQAIRYRDLVLPANVKAMIKITPQGVENLRYDANRDGVFETVVAPTVAISGAAAQDTSPPTITMSRTGPLNNATITLAATDSGSGVKTLLYSRDGVHYQPYTGPVRIDTIQTPALYAFADDNVANRSSLVTYRFPASLSGRPVSSALPNWAAGHLIDGNPQSTWSSVGHWEHLAQSEWASVSLLTPTTVDRMRIAPRAGREGLTYSFPKDFVIGFSSNGAGHTCDPANPRFTQVDNWQPLVSRSGYQQPPNAPIEFGFAPVQAQCFRILGTQLTQDDYGVRYLQLSEIELFVRPPLLP